MPRESKQALSGRKFLGSALVVLVVVVWVAWWQWDAFRGSGSQPPASAEGFPDRLPPAKGGVAERTAEHPAVSAAEARWTELLGSPPHWPDDLTAPRDCAAVEAELAALCKVLDGREPLSRASVAGGSCGLLLDVAVELAARPPALSSELESHASMLANVFHLHRVVGGERLALLKGVLTGDAVMVEPLALAIYRWAVSRETCARSGTTPLRGEVLYAYASFLFQTLGGQAYLRRRSPRVETLASFYALLVLEGAQRARNNPLGLDARPEIRRTRELVAGQSLVFRERYLEVLDAIEREWGRGGG